MKMMRGKKGSLYAIVSILLILIIISASIVYLVVNSEKKEKYETSSISGKELPNANADKKYYIYADQYTYDGYMEDYSYFYVEFKLEWQDGDYYTWYGTKKYYSSELSYSIEDTSIVSVDIWSPPVTPDQAGCIVLDLNKPGKTGITISSTNGSSIHINVIVRSRSYSPLNPEVDTSSYVTLKKHSVSIEEGEYCTVLLDTNTSGDVYYRIGNESIVQMYSCGKTRIYFKGLSEGTTTIHVYVLGQYNIEYGDDVTVTVTSGSSNENQKQKPAEPQPDNNQTPTGSGRRRKWSVEEVHIRQPLKQILLKLEK